MNQCKPNMNQCKPNMNQCSGNNGAGKGDKPRSCFSDSFKQNYENINWKKENQKSLIKKELKKQNGSSTYIYK
jgi:hypothetical protein